MPESPQATEKPSLKQQKLWELLPHAPPGSSAPPAKKPKVQTELSSLDSPLRKFLLNDNPNGFEQNDYIDKLFKCEYPRLTCTGVDGIWESGPIPSACVCYVAKLLGTHTRDTAVAKHMKKKEVDWRKVFAQAESMCANEKNYRMTKPQLLDFLFLLETFEKKHSNNKPPHNANYTYFVRWCCRNFELVTSSRSSGNR